MSLKVTVTGPAWTGKSTLAAELANYLKERGASVVFRDGNQPANPDRFGKPETWQGRRVLVEADNS